MHLDRSRLAAEQLLAAFGVLEWAVDYDSLAVVVRDHSSPRVGETLHHTQLNCFVAEALVHTPVVDIAAIVLHNQLAVLHCRNAEIAIAGLIADCTNRDAARSPSRRCILDLEVVRGWKSHMRRVVEDLYSLPKECSACHRNPAEASGSAAATVEAAWACCSSGWRQHDLVAAELVRHCATFAQLARVQRAC